MAWPKKTPQTMRALFNSKYVVCQTSGCWLWTHSRTKDGYGAMRVGGRSGKLLRAHRVAWELYRGPISQGLLVCHKCDVRACVNPEHLFLGSYQDNKDDAVEKRRHAHGERVSRRKLSEDDVRLLRLLYENGIAASTLSRRFGISHRHVNSITAGRKWKLCA